jgi:diadenosine tetraphosphate (Ap4A) HIT family hydrolase
MPPCYTCQLVTQRDTGTAPLWDNIYRTDHWDVVHSYNTALLGWTVLVTRRHITAIHDMTDAEANELGQLIRQVSIALKETTGCPKTYVVQFAEAADHPHVHFHIIPRMADQPPDRKSTDIFKYLGVPENERVSEDAMTDIASKIRRILNDLNSD